MRGMLIEYFFARSRHIHYKISFFSLFRDQSGCGDEWHTFQHLRNSYISFRWKGHETRSCGGTLQLEGWMSFMCVDLAEFVCEGNAQSESFCRYAYERMQQVAL